MRARSRARAEALHLIGDVFDRGLRGAVRDRVAAIPEFGDLLPESDDEAGARFEDLVSFGVLPFAGAFLDEGGRIGGPAGELVLRAHAAVGWAEARRDRPVEHVASELAFLGFLLAEERIPEATAFRDAHVMAWLPAWAHAVARHGEADYARIAGMAVDLVAGLPSAGRADPSMLPAVPDVAADPKAGVSDLARHLTTHAFTGMYLGRADIGRMGRALGIPRGFGSRALTFGNLVRSAAHYGRLHGLMDQMEQIRTDTIRAWQALGPAGDPWTAVWLQRLDATRVLLETIRNGLDGFAAGDSLA